MACSFSTVWSLTTRHPQGSLRWPPYPRRFSLPLPRYPPHLLCSTGHALQLQVICLLICLFLPLHHKPRESKDLASLVRGSVCSMLPSMWCMLDKFWLNKCVPKTLTIVPFESMLTSGIYQVPNESPWLFPSVLQLPYFMNELTLTELDMGVAVPKILQAFKPYVDHQGNS